MSERTSVMLRLIGLRGTEVGWYGPVSDAQVQSLAIKTLGQPPGMDLIYRDPRDRSVVALCGVLPSGLILDVEMRATSRGVTGTFRKQLIKFENIQAHLANERTWLAWVRTSLSALSVAFSLLTLVEYSKKAWLSAMLFLLGGGFIISVFTTFVAGWLRYARVRDVLMLAKREVPTHLHRIGISHQARFLCILFVILTIIYLAGARCLT